MANRTDIAPQKRHLVRHGRCSFEKRMSEFCFSLQMAILQKDTDCVV